MKPPKHHILLTLTSMALVLVCVSAAPGYGQDTQQILSQAARIYTEGGGTAAGSSPAFSPWALMGGILFSCIGFVAFIYGKRNSEFRPMSLGLALMIYPYVIRGVLWTYLIGIGLTAALYFWRE